MAYPIIKSVFDNFTTAYQNAREARAREERAKELSMREFDANQRAWNQDYRVGDQYTNYRSPANQYALRGLGRADELGIANQGGNLAVANSNTDILRGLYTPENTAREITRVNSDRDVIARMAAGRSALPSGVLYSAAQAPYYAGAVGGVNAQSDLAWLNSPEYQAYKNQTRKDSVTLGRINNEYNIGIANSQLTEMQNAENKATTQEETARLLRRNPAPTTSSNNSSTNPMQGMVNSNNSELNKLIIARDAVVSEMTPMIRSGIGMENAKYQALNLKLAAINDAILQSRVNQIPR